MFFSKEAGSTSSPASNCSSIFTSAPLTPLARCAQYESTEMRSRRGSNRWINFSSGSNNSMFLKLYRNLNFLDLDQVEWPWLSQNRKRINANSTNETKSANFLMDF